MSLWQRAQAVMPGGVNSPVRSFAAVGGIPPFAASAVGPYITTTEGRELIDFIASWGALIFGHADPRITEPVIAAARGGTSFGIPTAAELELAETIVSMVPSIDVVRMVNSGTEATATAIRLARAATGRSGIIKFAGGYHGHADAFLVKTGSGAATLGEPDSPGVPAATVADTRTARFGDLESVEACFGEGDIAAVIVEPVTGNMGVVPPAQGFLEGLREQCDTHDVLLIFDEVMTGFRVGPGGAQERYGVTPDLTTLGKIIAGGTPAAAYGGREDLMRMISPDGPVYQAGTLSGNSLAVAAGLGCLRAIGADLAIYDRLEKMGAELEENLNATLAETGRTGVVQRVGAMLTVFLGPATVTSWDDTAAIDNDWFSRFHRHALDDGVLLPPSPYEAWFLMDSHQDVIEQAGDVLHRAIVESA